ncbi:unnamed protein product, partial [Cyprideis torosa]
MARLGTFGMRWVGHALGESLLQFSDLILSFICSPKVLNKETQALHLTFVEYIDNARHKQFFETEAETSLKSHFASFISRLVRSFPLESREVLISTSLRDNLFRLFSEWVGHYRFEPQHGGQYKLDQPLTTELEFQALQAMCAVLTCGRCFESKSLLEDGKLYSWLNQLLDSPEEKVASLGRETLVLLLDFNSDTQSLLDWVVGRCYTGSKLVAESCFMAISTIFNAKEYPCDHYISIINLTLLNTGHPKAQVQATAFHLLLLLDKRFFCLRSPILHDDVEGDGGSHSEEPSLDSLLSNSYCRS